VIESSRIQWEDARQRLEGEQDPARQQQLFVLVDAVLSELRRDLGSMFSLSELDGRYAEAERWAIQIVSDAAPRASARVGPADATLVQDAAFDMYARGAGDYKP
jgi:hypothetical protein